MPITDGNFRARTLMPIQFRCSHCGQLLSISRRKAGELVTCPQCVRRTRVPQASPAQLGPAGEIERLREITGGKTLETDQQARQAWKHHPNPWAGEEEEEEDFRIAAPVLQEAGLDMTPMVDVTFLLLIFFMITASFSMQKSLETTPPQPDQAGAALSLTIQEVEDDSVVVEIDGENQIRVDDVPVAGLGELRDVLAGKIANENKTEMLIEADAAASHGTVVTVMDAGLEVQMQRIRRSSKRGEQ
jgi:biopolymer transport protein ExbD